MNNLPGLSLVILSINFLFASKFYFAFTALIGQSDQQHNTTFFSLYCFLSALSVLCVFSYLFFRSSTFRPISLLIPAFFTSLYSISFLIADYTSYSLNQFFLFLLFAPAGFCVGVIFARKSLPFVDWAILFVAIIATLSTLAVFPVLLQSSIISLLTFYGGGNYQSYSHFSSISFLFLLSLFYTRESRRSAGFTVITFLCMLVLSAGTLLSGGRSGAFIIPIGSLLILTKNNFLLKKTSIPYFALFFLVVLFLFVFVLPSFVADNYYRIIASTDRVFSILSEGIGNSVASSNRDIFFSESISLFNERPIFGYGGPLGLSMAKDTFYSHNIILDVLLHGGIVGLIFYLPLIVYPAVRLLLLPLKSPLDYLVFNSLVYCLVVLSFSGSYLTEPLFWFVLGYAYSSSARRVSGLN